MPKRKHTRAHQRQQLINQVRTANEERIAEMSMATEEFDEPAPF